MTDDFYCNEALSGHTPVKKVLETDNVLAFHHTKPHWPVHIVVIPKKHIPSLLHLKKVYDKIMLEVFDVIKKIAAKVKKETGSCRILTNQGTYQDSKHLHFHVSSGDPKC